MVPLRHIAVTVKCICAAVVRAAFTLEPPQVAMRLFLFVILNSHRNRQQLRFFDAQRQLINMQQCSKHDNSALQLYCKSCDELACVICAYGPHKKHDILLLADAVDGVVFKLNEQTNAASSSIANIEAASVLIRSNLQEVEAVCPSASHCLIF